MVKLQPELKSIRIDMTRHSDTSLAIIHDYSRHNRLLYVKLPGEETITGMPRQQ